MNNTEIKQALFEAFSAGNYRVNNTIPVGSLQERFDEWLKAKYPSIDKPSNPELDARDQMVMENFLASRPKRYYHNFGCSADTRTPHGEGNCTCDGSGDPTKK